MRFRAMAAIWLLLASPVLADRTSEDAALAAARREYLNRPGMEADALAAAHGRAVRKGDGLSLNLANRPTVTLADNGAACADDNAVDCVRFTLVADLPSRHAYLVAKSYYEGCADLLLIDDRSGRQSTLADVPVFSPDGERLLIQNECEADGSASDNHLEIWRRQRDGWILEWAYTDQQAYAADKSLQNVFLSNVVSWQNDRITMTFIDRAYGEVPERRWLGALSRIHGRWVLKAGMLHSP